MATYYKTPLVILLSLIFVSSFFVLLVMVFTPGAKYVQADKLLQEGKYEEAIVAFEDLKGWGDSATKINECKYQKAEFLLENGEEDEAYKIFISIDGYKDSMDRAEQIKELSFVTSEEIGRAHV